MRLMKLSHYRKLVYAAGSAPSLGTLRKRITEIQGGTILHGHYYVDMEKLERVTDLLADARAREQEMAQDPLLRGLV
jgi:hypothetical protein